VMKGKGTREGSEGKRERGGRVEWAGSLREASDIQKWSPRSALLSAFSQKHLFGSSQTFREHSIFPLPSMELNGYKSDTVTMQ
jgi:hypothetical protein